MPTLDELYRQYAPEGGVSHRTSPLGYTEYVVPTTGMMLDLWDLNKRLAYASPKHGKHAVYRADQDKPSIRQHERIHLGQMNLDYQPGPMQIIHEFAKAGIDSIRGISDPSYEVPAYTFQESYKQLPSRTPAEKQAQQTAYDKYIELIRRYNPGKSYHVEAAVPEDLARSNITRQPAYEGPRGLREDLVDVQYQSNDPLAALWRTLVDAFSR